MEQDKNAIRVVCRMRPLNSLEMSMGGESCLSFQNNTIQLKLQDSTKHSFTFDRVFGPDSTQKQVFAEVAKQALSNLLQGYNSTIFAYGQTSSGKTFTMEGPSHDDAELKGLIPRVMETLFEMISDASEDEEFQVKVSFLEIYNEKIQDLLDTNKYNLQVKEDKIKGIFVQNLTEVYVGTADHMKNVMKLGANNRTIAATRMNENSSRSHSLFILQVQSKNTKLETTKHAKLYFVDLAGSEKVDKTNVKGQQLEEAKNINKSLTCLGMVINALTSEKATHIPYRDSKLTRILQESLGGNAKTTLIIAVSMCTYNDHETLSTLRFGQRAKAIKNKPILNQERSVKELEMLLNQANLKILQYEEILKQKITIPIQSPKIDEDEEEEVEQEQEIEKEQKNSSKNINRLGKIELGQIIEQKYEDEEDIEQIKKQYQEQQLKILKQHLQIQELERNKEDLNNENNKLQDKLSIFETESEEYKQNIELLQQENKQLWSKLQKANLDVEHLKIQNQEKLFKQEERKHLFLQAKQDLNYHLLSVQLKQMSGLVNDTESVAEMFNEQNEMLTEERTVQSLGKLLEIIEDLDKILRFDESIETTQEIRKHIANSDRDLPVTQSIDNTEEDFKVNFILLDFEDSINQKIEKERSNTFEEDIELEKIIQVWDQENICEMISQQRKKLAGLQQKNKQLQQIIDQLQNQCDQQNINGKKLKELYKRKTYEHQNKVEELTQSIAKHQHEISRLNTENHHLQEKILLIKEDQNFITKLVSFDKNYQNQPLTQAIAALIQERQLLQGQIQELRGSKEEISEKLLYHEREHSKLIIEKQREIDMLNQKLAEAKLQYFQSGLKKQSRPPPQAAAPNEGLYQHEAAQALITRGKHKNNQETDPQHSGIESSSQDSNVQRDSSFFYDQQLDKRKSGKDDKEIIITQ